MLKNAVIALLVATLPSLAAVIGPATAKDSSECPRGALYAGLSETEKKDCLDPLSQAAGPDDKKESNSAATAAAQESITRAPGFTYVFQRPENPSGETIILLHGSGGNETSMFRLASRIAPHATLLGVRGRIVQKGVKRWYARITPTEFDQDDIRKESRALADFLQEKIATERLDPNRVTFIGYSNGANLIAAMTLLHPGLIHRAVLLRAMPVLSVVPPVDLRRSRFLTVAGKKDKVYGPFAPALEALLRDRGATVDSHAIQTGHLLGDEDIKVVSEWLSAAETTITETSR